MTCATAVGARCTGAGRNGTHPTVSARTLARPALTYDPRARTAHSRPSPTHSPGTSRGPPNSCPRRCTAWPTRHGGARSSRRRGPRSGAAHGTAQSSARHGHGGGYSPRRRGSRRCSPWNGVARNGAALGAKRRGSALRGARGSRSDGEAHTARSGTSHSAMQRSPRRGMGRRCSSLPQTQRAHQWQRQLARIGWSGLGRVGCWSACRIVCYVRAPAVPMKAAPTRTRPRARESAGSARS